jgi:methionine--tRNA ligase beta chain
MREISFEEFQNLDLRVGKILKAERIPKTRNLLRLEVDFGTEKRQAISGIAQYYKPEDLVGKKYVFILNLQKKKFFGYESECMILAAENEEKVSLIQPDQDIKEGTKVH